jgi:hypothetical protein
VIFFSAWLSHVPMCRFERFSLLLRRLLAEDGRVLFIDEPIDVRDKEAYVPGTDEIVERRLNDGRAFRVVKNFIDPDALQARLQMGWHCVIRNGIELVYGEDSLDLVYGEARLAS